MKKVQNTDEPMPNFFLVCVDFIVFLALFSNFKPPPPHPLHKGSAVYLTIEYWADSDLGGGGGGGAGVLSFSPHT